MRARIASRLRGIAREEHGVAIVYVLVVLVIVLGFGAAVIAETVASRHLASYNNRQRRAQQGAEAGIQSQLYLAEQGNFSAPYNFSGGVLGINGFLDCVVRQFNASGQVIGVTVVASSAGICPRFSGPGSGTALWTGLGNHTYEADELLTNKQETGGSGFGAVVEFPQILAIGCDTTTASTCGSAPTTAGPVYARELLYLQPTGPLDGIEGMGNVNVNGVTLLGIPLAVTVNGDIMADQKLTLPAASVGINTNANWPPGASVLPTFGYGTTYAGATLTTANVVHLTGGFCTLGSPSTSCMIKRAAPSITSTSCSACTSGITCTSCVGGGYSGSVTDTFTLTAGTATFAPGDYVFCNFSVTGSGRLTTTTSPSGPVRIFIRSPTSTGCSSTQGNFTAANGFANTLTGTINNVSSTLDPSGVQIYVQGDGSYDNNTSVTIGSTSQTSALSQAMIIYAPTSKVTVTTSACGSILSGVCTLLGSGLGGTFAGSVIGDDVTITAGVITQDLDIGNMPLYSGTNAQQPAQYVQCDTSARSLSGSSSDTTGC